MFSASAGLLIDHDLVAAISAGQLSLLEEWSVELEQQWKPRPEGVSLVLLAAGLRWQANGGRDPDRPLVASLPAALSPVLQQLALRLGARLVVVHPEGDASGGPDWRDLLEAPLLLAATSRDAAALLSAGLLADSTGQLLSLWGPGERQERVRRERFHGGRKLAGLDGMDLPSRQPLRQLAECDSHVEKPSRGWRRHWPPLLLLLALLLGVLLWQWSGRVLPGLVLIGASWWWLSRRPELRQRNRRWCSQQLLQLQRLWADFQLPERVRDQLHDDGGSADEQLALRQLLQAHRLHLHLECPRTETWQRADLIDALELFEGLQAQLRSGDRQWARRQLLLRLLALVLVVALVLAVVLDQVWTDGLVLPVAALLAMLNLQQALPLLLPRRRQRGIAALERPLTVLRRGQRSDHLMPGTAVRRDVEQAVLTAGRELVDLVNDSFSTGGGIGEL